jgi:outer membrane protein OmpA-like peptidoglycan-associated protein
MVNTGVCFGGELILRGRFMKRLLNSTAALSVALMHVQPSPLWAQVVTDTGSIIAVDGTVLCEPSAEIACDPGNADLIGQAQMIEAQIADAQAQADAEAAAAADAQAQADAEAAAAADAQAQADAEAAAADAQAKADAEAAAAADAQAKADAEAAAAADAQAKADAEAAADAQAQADADAAAADAQAKADAEAAAAADAQAQADAEAAAADAQAKADAEAAAADAQAKADAEAAAADAQAQADAEAANADVQAKADAEAAAAADAQAKVDAEAAAADAQVKADAEAAAAAEAQPKAEGAAPTDVTTADPNAGLKTADDVSDPAAPPVEAPVVSEAEMQALSNLLSGEATDTATATAQPMAATETGPRAADAAPSSDAVTATTETVTDETSRRATQEFSAAPQVVAPGKKNRLSDLEKAGLIGLGALVVGAVIMQGNRASNADQPQQQVISNTGDRVIVQRADGNYQVYKDDDALLRRPGNTLRTEIYKDGSTLTTVDRADGTQIVTIRNATGRVLRRAHYDSQGFETVLFNDLEPEREIIVSTLPKPRDRSFAISTQDGDAAMKAALASRQIEKIGRTFSLRQVREIPQVRHLAAIIDVDKITFASGSAALSTTEVNALSDLGSVMQSILDANKNEVFLIEGHTDATGAGAMNLALSDRRAETVALALTEYFDIPPENMVVQGYGETELLIDTQADEKRNRRVGVRIITPLL